LIHDDLLDHSAVRRGAPAMHVLLGRQAPRSRSKPGRSREGLAMLAGDVLFAAAVEAFATATRDAARAREALQMLMRAAVSTGTGAFLEVSTRERPLKQISRRTVLRICELKTALYTFVCPLTTGAWLAGAAPAECQRLDACGRLLGRAYQLRDDLADLRACLTPGGRAEAPTFDETRTTLPVWYAFKAASRREQAWMQRLYDRSSPTSADLANLRRLLERTQALARTDRLIQRLLRQADHTAGQLALPAAARERLTHCIHEFFVPAGAPEAARPC